MNIFEEWIDKARSLGASDVHLESNSALVVRIRGELHAVGGAIAGAQIVQAAQGILGADGWADLLERGSADIAVAIHGARCRASFFKTVRGLAVAVRLLSTSIKDLRACNLHPDFRRFIEATSGLVLICGPTGSGKSTTLGALIEEINASRSRHIVTLESPIEYIFSNRQSYIRQREIPTHSPSVEQGVVDALRENPDVLVISEMRTPEVMRLTLNAAETGHLVLATMHSATCAEALSRLCMSFPADLQPSVRAQLADCLVGMSAQRLEFLGDFGLKIPKAEILLPSSGAKGTIRAGNFSQIANVLQSGGEEGMWTFDRYQRWMDQHSDWVTQTAGHARDTATTAVDLHKLPAFASEEKTSNAGIHALPKATTKTTRLASVAPPSTGEYVIDVPPEEMDLTQLAELAKKIGERSPK